MSFLELPMLLCCVASALRAVRCADPVSLLSRKVPHFLLDDAMERGGAEASRVRIVVTQPRRVAAVSLAERVATECGEKGGAGGLVG